MASATSQLLTNDWSKAMKKAGGGLTRPSWTLGETSTLGGRPIVRGNYKTGRTLVEAPNATLARASATPAAVPAKGLIGSRRFSSLVGTAASAFTDRRAAAAAPALRTATAAAATTATATTATGARAATRKAPASAAAAAGSTTASAPAVTPAVTAARASTSSPAAASRKGLPTTTTTTTAAATTGAAARKAPAFGSAAPSRTASAVAPAVAASRASTSSPAAAAAAARTARASSASASAHTATAAAATSSASRSSSGNHVPLVLDPKRPNNAAVLLKEPKDEYDSAVWRTWLGEREVVVKQTPFHSSRRAAAIQTLWGKDQAAHIVITEKEARHEAATVVRMKGIFVQPLQVLERGYSRQARSSVTCPDREIITVMPYYPCGDAAQYISHVATSVIAAFKAGNRSLDSAVKELMEVLTRFARDMFSLVSPVHQQGFVLVDHKLENMVYDAVKSCWLLIDAGEVQRCVLGSKLMGKSLCAPLYAAPEQKQGKWADSRSDVFTCGKCIHVAVGDCFQCFTAVLGDGTDALAEAEAAFGEALKPLKEDVLRPCCNECEPTARPSAAAVVRTLRDPRHQQ